MNKITKVAMVAFSLMFLKSVTVHAQIVDNQTVGKYKAWTIKFNKTVKFDDTVKNKVHVFDNKHNIISVSVNKGNSDIFQGEFALDGSYIYCNNGGTVNKIKTDAVSGDAGTTIINNVRGPLYIYDGMIYYGLHSSDYISKFNLGRANEDGTGVLSLNVKNLNCVNFSGDSIYYSADENNTLYKANLDGSNHMTLRN